MHPPVREFVARCLDGLDFDRVVEVGSRDVNGGVRDLIRSRHYLGLDLEPGGGVDLVMDARAYRPGIAPDLVVCCEVLEHDPDPAELLDVMGSWLGPGGWLLVTCATDGRAPHSAVDGGQVREGEWYGNVPAAVVSAVGWGSVAVLEVDDLVGDLRALIVKNNQGAGQMAEQKIPMVYVDMPDPDPQPFLVPEGLERVGADEPADISVQGFGDPVELRFRVKKAA